MTAGLLSLPPIELLWEGYEWLRVTVASWVGVPGARAVTLQRSHADEAVIGARSDHTRESQFTGEVLDASALHGLDAAEWDQLSASALYDNPFYSRQYLLAGLATIDRGADLRAVVIRDGAGRLAGLFPFRKRLMPPFPWRVARGAENRHQFSGTPLVAADNAASVIGMWLDVVKAGHVPRFWALGNLNLDSGVKRLIDEAACARGLTSTVVLPYERAHLTRQPGGFDAHCAEAISKSRLRDIRRNLRRLQDMGELVFERVSDPALVRERLEQFLAMEHSGWKGEMGTAFLSDSEDAAFARRAFGGEADAQGLTSADSLLLDGKPIAISINIASGTTAFTAKCAYDESLRKQSPGLVLEYLVVERFYVDDTFTDMDAATTTGGHVVQGFWNDTKRMGRVIVGPDDWRTRFFAGVWAAAHHGRKRLRTLLRK